MSVEVRIVEAEALRIGPGEVLVLRFDPDAFPPEQHQELMDGFMSALEAVGLGKRALVMIADAEMVVVPRDP